MKTIEAVNDFTQLCVWPACVVGENKIQEFEQFMKDEFNARIKYCEEVITKAGDGGEGGRNDIFFYVHTEDISHFAVKRLLYSIHWWEDIKGSALWIYPTEIQGKYKRTW